MNAQKIADKLVEAGILSNNPHQHHLYQLRYEGEKWLAPECCITDWRVAGACLKAWPTTINTESLDMTLDQMLRDPVAICEAFAAQENEE